MVQDEIGGQGNAGNDGAIRKEIFFWTMISEIHRKITELLLELDGKLRVGGA